MQSVNPNEVESVVRTAKSDWKSVASLLLAALFFVVTVTWMITGYVVRGADTQIKANTMGLAEMDSRQKLFDSQVKSLEKRQDEILLEIKSVSVKVSSMAESQARMEGVLIGKK